MPKTKIQFTKMAGAGNDFIVIDAQKGLNYKRLAPKACDRTNGIGADGLIVLDRSAKEDYRMRIINADGSEAEMCGNGVRCLSTYIVANRKPKKNLFSIETLAGTILGEAKGEIANVRLSDPTDCRLNLTLTVNDREISVDYINTGVPHAVIYVQDLKNIDVKAIGETIRNHKAFAPKGTNVNFVEINDKALVSNRTFERGVEDETKACGTGSVACAILSYLKLNPDVRTKKNARMNVRTQGGEVLKVTFDIIDGAIMNVWLKGSAKFIAKGEYYV